MKKLLNILILLLITSVSFGQGLFVTGGYVIMSNNVYVVIDRQASDGITRTGGGIINQDNKEGNYIDWIVKNGSTNNYTIPWTTSSQYIPFIYQITSSGTNDGRMLFSTWQTQSDNTTPIAVGATGWPTGVTNVNPDPLYAADRFWWIIYSGYSTKPQGSLTFSYVDPTEIQAPNTITETDLQAQYWNAQWIGPPTGTDNPGSNYVDGVSSQSFDAPWVLVSKQSPLPVELLTFDGICDNGYIHLSWSTASETNNNYFTVQKSVDSYVWSDVTVINGNGNSNEILYYSYIDVYEFDQKYYRLKQNDYDGNYSYSGVLYIEGCDDSLPNVIMYPNPIIGEFIIDIRNVDCFDADIVFYNDVGQLIYQKKLMDLNTIKKHFIDLSLLSKGFYYVNFRCKGFNKTQKFLKE